MADQAQGRRALAQFLRSRRGRVNPAAVGLPVGSRRRLGGLRREEVAVLAGVSPTWYTYLEQGRKISPSPEVLDSLARVLGLSEDERRYMHTLAYGHVVHPQPLRSEVSEAALVQQLVDVAYEHSPYPVYAVDLYCDLIAWNPAATEWYDDWGRLPPTERNIMHWLLTSETARQRLVDWESDACDIVARWRSMTAAQLEDRRLQQLIDRFRDLSKDFTCWWDDHDVREHRVRTRRFRHPRLGLQSLRLLVLEAPEFSPSVVVFHLPSHPVVSQ